VGCALLRLPQSHLTGTLMHLALSLRAAAVGRGGRVTGGGGGAGAAAGVGGAAAPKPVAQYLATEVPAEYRAQCCIPFWQHGRCSRPRCTHAATGHKCLRCGAADHGGAQCPRA
jgi:hypothetical protein